MIHYGLLAGGFESDMQTSATIGLGFFVLLTGLVWAGVLALRRIAKALEEANAQKGTEVDDGS